MNLSPQTSLAHYDIVSSLGAGGMGEVYRAVDTKLDREVAIKVLPEDFADHPERIARFEREAKLLASLNHPNIATLFGFEQEGTRHFLVMELVDGEDLAERLRRGPIPLDEAIPLFIQIAEGLEAAHEKGIIHRDLKPANIKVTEDGRAKVLDFGLAKALDDKLENGAENPDLTQLPTMAASATRAGLVMGTAAYMSPEQARGRKVDQRADVWAFGCCLYETLTGSKAFDGADATALMATILRDSPDESRLPASTPHLVRWMLARCFAKDPAARLRSVRDASLMLEGAFEQGAPSAAPAQASTAKRWTPWLLAAGMAVVTVLALAWGTGRTASEALVASDVRRLSITLPEELPLSVSTNIRVPSLAVARDGRSFVYTAESPSLETVLVRRDLSEGHVEPIRGTEGAQSPVLSPDGLWVSFIAGGQLRKVSIQGSEPVVLAPAILNGAWTADGDLLYTPKIGVGIHKVSENGGEPVRLLPNTDRLHVHPQMLPGGEALLLTLGTSATVAGSTAAIYDLSSGEVTELAQESTRATYLSSGHIVFTREDGLFALPFDVQRLVATGPEVAVTETSMPEGGQPREYGVSQAGLLIFAPSHIAGREEFELMRIDADGSSGVLGIKAAQYGTVAISPDGRYAALDLRDFSEIVVVDLERKVLQKVVDREALGEELRVIRPRWHPGGDSLTFTVLGLEQFFSDIRSRKVSGVGKISIVSAAGSRTLGAGWSPDGRWLLLDNGFGTRGRDVFLADPQNPDSMPRRLLGGPFDEGEPTISPDGHWLAYASDERDGAQIYVRPFPDVDSDKLVVTSKGGTSPVWVGREQGMALVYRRDDRLYRVSFEAGRPPRFGTPEPLIQHSALRSHAIYGRNWDASPDGQWFLVLSSVTEVEEDRTPSSRLLVVENWFEELKRLVPTE